jgi:hypothetical protein
VPVCPCRGPVQGQNRQRGQLPAPCWDAATATCWAATLAVSTRDAGQATGPGDDHVVRLVTPLHRSDIDVIQREH